MTLLAAPLRPIVARKQRLSWGQFLGTSSTVAEEAQGPSSKGSSGESNADLEPGSSELRALPDLAPGDRATVRSVPDGDAELLRYLEELALLPECEIELVGLAPFAGPISFRSRTGEHAISRELAAAIRVA